MGTFRIRILRQIKINEKIVGSTHAIFLQRDFEKLIFLSDLPYNSDY